MREVIPLRLWTGHARDGRDLRALHSTGIQAVVDLAAEEPPPCLSHDLITIRIPLNDGGENPPEMLSLAIQSVTTLVQFDIPTLVCCSAGLSRSPSVTAAALIQIRNLTPGAALRLVAGDHASMVSRQLWRDLLAVTGISASDS